MAAAASTLTLEVVREQIPDYARDLKLNLGSVLSSAGAPGLNERQIWALALASAIGAGNGQFAQQIAQLAADKLDAATFQASQAAAAIMGMNNVYYRFLHLVEDAEYSGLPARLRMNVMANPGIDKADFELLALAVSAINGCGKCIQAHERALRGHHGMSREQIQSAVRIASVIAAVAAVLEYQRAA